MTEIEQNDYHALLNQKTDFGHTPLILSVKLIPSNIQYYDVVKLLLQKGKSPLTHLRLKYMNKNK